jgi:DNA polymerase IV (DinB-like DNA polymerase)
MNFIIFVDFDYFFAQVEEILNPSLKGKPVVVCVYSGRSENSGAVATANYEARKLGIRAGMPISKAKEIAPYAIFLPMRKDLYKKFSDKVMKILEKFSDKIEIASIDEAYLNISHLVKDFKEAENLGRIIKNEIFNETKLKVTIGISFNKTLAKIAAELAKPDGLKVIDNRNVREILENLNIDDVPGLGKVLAEKLKNSGITKLGEIRNLNFEKLRQLIGESRARYLIKLLNLNLYEDVRPKKKKSIARTLTLKENSRDINYIAPYLYKAVNEAYERITGIPRNLSVFIITEDLDIVSRAKTFRYGLIKEQAYNEALKLLKELLEKEKRNVRRVGVRLSKIYTTSNLENFFNSKINQTF